MSATTLGSPPAAKPRRRKWPFRVLWGLLAVVLGLGLYWSWRHHSAIAERDALIAELHAKGEPVWWDEVVDRLLAEPAEETGAELYLKALWALGGDYNPAGPRLPSGVLWDASFIHGRLMAAPGVSLEPVVDPRIREQLKLAAPTFAALDQAVERKSGLVSRNVKGRLLRQSDPYRFLLPHIQDSRGLVRMNFWRIYDALARKAPAEACHAAWVGLAASEQLSNEPWILTQFVRLDMQLHACRHLAFCLQYAAVPDADFQRLDAFFASLEDSFRLDGVFRADRALGLHVWSSGEVTKDVIVSSALVPRSANPFMDGASKAWLSILGSPLVAPARVETQVAELRFYARIADKIDRPDVDLKEFDDAVAAYEAAAPIHRLVSIPAGKSKSVRTFAKYVVIAHRRLILHRLALRLRRHYDRHGKFPERLDELCDAVMPTIRLDWFQNHPIVYTPSADGFRLEAAEAARFKEDEPVEIKLEKLP
jgi:hypothetical protein